MKTINSKTVKKDFLLKNNPLVKEFSFFSKPVKTLGALFFCFKMYKLKAEKNIKMANMPNWYSALVEVAPKLYFRIRKNVSDPL